MRILQIVPEMRMGGVETGTLDLARELVRRGHASFVASAGGPLVEALRASGTKHIELPVHRKSLPNIWRMSRRLRQIIRDEKIDIVHARSRVPAWIGCFAVRGTPARFLTTAHGLYRAHFGSRVMSWGERVIAISRAVQNHLMNQFSVHPSRIDVIPRGVDLKKFQFQPKPLSKDTIRIGMVGRLSPIKGHEYFLRAMKQVVNAFPQAKGLIIGDAAESKKEYQASLLRLRQELALDSHVDFCPGATDIAQTMAQLDLLVLATTMPEAFGRVIIEAQALGIPAIGTNVGGVREVIEDGKTGWLVPPRDEKALADAIFHALKNPDLIHTVVREARRRVEEKYNLDQMVERTLKVYQGLLKSPRILVTKFGALGDLVLASPSLRALKERYPTSELTFLTDSRYQELVKHSPYVNHVLGGNLKKAFWKDFQRFLKEIRLRRFDILIDLQNNKKSHGLGFLSGIPERVGFARGGRGWMLTRKISYSKALGPIESQARLLDLINVKIEDPRLEFRSSHEDQLFVDQFLKENKPDQALPLVALFPFSNPRWETKRWGLDRFMELARKIDEELKAGVVFLGGVEDRASCETLSHGLKTPFIDAIGRLSMGQLAELLKRCKALVSGDSAPLHVAAAVRTPVVALFGPTDPRRHAPPGLVKVLTHPVPCSPCYSPMCKIKTHDCLQKLSVDYILEAVKNFLDLTPQSATLNLQYGT